MRRGEMYDARLDPTEGSEQAGSRPVILAVPCTTYRPGRCLYTSQVLLRAPRRWQPWIKRC